jgi:transcriptional regulator with XRE-family HTH domain
MQDAASAGAGKSRMPLPNASPKAARLQGFARPSGAATPVASVPAVPPRRESADSVLAKNLVVARLAAGFTQQELALAADVSRATIAQIETGYSDPRLSTIVDLAEALGIAPILLLTGTPEVLALTALRAQTGGTGLLEVSPHDQARMTHLANTGMLKDRVRAAQVGAAIARAAGKASPAVVAAAIFSAIHPGPGTTVGALLGELAENAVTTQRPVG